MIYAVISLDNDTIEDLRQQVGTQETTYLPEDLSHISFVDFDGTAEQLAGKMNLEGISHLIAGLAYYTGRGPSDLANWMHIRNAK